MARGARLQGIAHNIAHHAGSGLCSISPHLANALKLDGIETTNIDLLSEDPYPGNVAYIEPLSLSLSALRLKAEEILAKHNFRFRDLSELTLKATPAPWDRDGYCLHTRVVIVARAGKVFDSGWLNELGNT